MSEVGFTMLAREGSTRGRTVEKAAVRWVRVAVSFAAVSYGEGDEFYPTPMSLEGLDERGVFLGLGLHFGHAA